MPDTPAVKTANPSQPAQFRASAAAAASRSAAVRPAAGKASPRAYLTARGALLLAFMICLFACLIAAWRQADIVAGLGFCIAYLLAAGLVARAALLPVVIAPPAIFMLALLVSQVATAQGTSSRGSFLSVLEGALLTLAAVAPWLFGGTAASVAVAMARGLPDIIRGLRDGPGADQPSGD